MKKKKYLGIGLLFVCCFLAGRTAGKLQAAFVPAAQMTVEEAKLAVIIDDFGYNGAGTAEMLALDIPFTAAVLPFSSHTAENAAQAKAAGKEVIGVGKISDIFERRGLTGSYPNEGNRKNMERTLEHA